MKSQSFLAVITLSFAFLFGSCRESSDRLLLIRSIQNSDTNQIVSLAKRGIDLSSPDVTGPRNTPLMWAVFEQRRAAAELLLRLGVDPNVRNRDGETVLIRLCGGGDANLELVELLLKHRADVNLKDNFGSTALASAMASDPPAPKLVELLKRNGAQ